jgi:hypothetical protein
VIALLALAACANVNTQVVQFDPAERYSPTHIVEVLLQKATRRTWSSRSSKRGAIWTRIC